MADKKKSDDLKDLCSKRAQRHGLSPDKLAPGLELLAIETIAQDPLLFDAIFQDGSPHDSDLSDWHTGGSGDGGIDGLLYNEDLSYVAIIQTKNKNGQIDADTLEEARSFFSRMSEWTNVDKRDDYNESTQRLLDESQLDPFSQQIDLYFVTSMTASKAGDHSDVADAATNAYQEAGKNVTCTILTQSEFLAMFHNAGSSLVAAAVPDVDLSIPEGDFFVNDTGPHRVLVAVIKGQELANLYNKRDVRNRLFNANVRAALTTGKINPKIQETASSDEESPMFLYYNNGVTATCSELSITKNIIHTRDLQVVNGAQTVAALGKALKRKANPKVRVLLRIIETDGKYRNKSKVADQITRYQNTQNPVKASDFFSNEPFQQWISLKFDELSGKRGFPQMWYEHKRGMKSGQSTAGRKKLTMEQLATLRYACVVDAPFTYKRAKDIWNGENNNAHYWQAFGSDGQEVVEWSQEELAEVSWMITTWNGLREIHAGFKKNKSQNPEKTYLGVLARYVTALAIDLVKHLQEEQKLPSFQELTANQSAYKTTMDDILKVCRRAVKDSLEREWNNKVANPRLNMPQDADTWSSLKQRVRSDYAFEHESD
jgi:hypothetical protein